jgi:hypothetical protein
MNEKIVEEKDVKKKGNGKKNGKFIKKDKKMEKIRQ